ncbi:MAG: hypothetical protein ABJF10_28440 [Chthoniobacter sp.]|uniref:hypothetical protein n=1 Tax=Chthoniobacter sp. TaxID=2510640 RepID=UPI0032A22567
MTSQELAGEAKAGNAARELLVIPGMKALFRALPLWLLLGSLAWLLATAWDADMTQPLTIGGLFVLPSLAVWLTAKTAAKLPVRWAWRVAFWALTISGWATLLVIAQGRAESHPSEWRNLLLGFGLAGCTALWLPVGMRSLLTWRTIGEATAVAATIAFSSGVFLWSYEAGTHSFAAQAEARWTEIGLPMMELEKTFVLGRENDGSEVVRQVFRERVGSHFYKEGTRAAEREPVITRSEEVEQAIKRAIDIQSAILPPSDDFELPPKSVAGFEPLGPVLEADYRRILAAAPPAWASDPRDGWSINVPNFLAIRQFSQITAAEAVRRLSVGDQEGAARALAAGLHLREGLRQNPTLVSLMLDVAVDSLLSAKKVRLPAEEDGLQSIAQDAISLRAELLKRLQLEGWLCLRFPDQFVENEPTAHFQIRCLPKWARQALARPWVRRQCALAALNGAEQAVIRKSPATLSLPDLGESLHEVVSEAHPSVMEFNITRAALRIHATLLLREQTELIRDARARLAAGRPVESRDSVVLPHLRWELTADAEKGTVRTRLVGAPEWIVKNEVTGPDFWVLPLDGSVAWQFHLPSRTTSRF